LVKRDVVGIWPNVISNPQRWGSRTTFKSPMYQTVSQI
jgi:hypothetical protein